MPLSGTTEKNVSIYFKKAILRSALSEKRAQRAPTGQRKNGNCEKTRQA